MAYYLKYRPQTISDLDNENVREILTSTLSVKEPPHAYLLTGPKGLGKTSSARIIAKVLNCQNKAKNSIEPCNKCETCVSITKGSSIDVIEIDAASNRGIDEIRELKEKIRLAPAQALKKVYIIDEVHMLTTEAFNALLKTLEEPPQHAVFVLATTEPQKIPETIISRCLHVSFHKATIQEIEHSLDRIVKGEDIKIDKDTLEEIVNLSDGGFRDGAKILEELVSLSDGKKIDSGLLEKRFKTRALGDASITILKAFSKKDAKEGIVFIRKISKEGIDFSYLLSKIIDDFHRALLFKVGVAQDKDVSEIASQLSLAEMSVLFSILTKAKEQMRFSPLEELPLELSLVEWAEMGQGHEAVVEIEEDVISNPEEITIKTLRRHAGNLVKNEFTKTESAKSGTKEKTTEKKNHDRNLLSYKSSGDHSEEWLNDFWQEIIHRMKDYNHTLAGVMRGCRIKSFDRKVLVIETKFSFHKERLGEEKTLHKIEEICSALTGNKVNVSLELTSK